MVRERQRYRVFDRGALIAEGTASECAAAAGLKPRTVQAYAADPRRSPRWRVEHVKGGGALPDEMRQDSQSEHVCCRMRDEKRR